MNSDRKIIFIVEDSPDIRDAIQMLYEGEAFRVITASNGMEALEWLRSCTELPGLILLDLMMPVMDGAQFKAEQEKDDRFASIPVVIMTADANADTKAISIGAKGYIRKPVKVDVLLAVAQKYCG